MTQRWFLLALFLQDVEAVIGDYDGDVGSRDKEHQAALKEYNMILLQVVIGI
jgi:hypothetical protein